MVRFIAVLVVVACVDALSSPARADEADALDRLFAALAQADTAAEAANIEADIWNAWVYAGAPDTDDLMDQGIVALQQGLLPLASAIFSSIIRVEPDLAEGWNKRATARYLMGRFDASVEDIAQTLEREPRHFGALFGLGLIYMDSGQDGAALKAFERVLVLYPQMEQARAHVRYLRAKIDGTKI